MTTQQYRDIFKDDIRVLGLLKSLGFEPETIWDVGASNASWAILCAEVFPDARYELFEPLAYLDTGYKEFWESGPYTRSFLEKPRRTLHELALGREPGVSKMTVYPSAPGSTLLPIDLKGGGDSIEINVEVSTVDKFISAGKAPAPCLLKMDFQGFEMDILQGAEQSLDKVSVILAECWLIRSYARMTPLISEMVEFMSKRGFEMLDVGSPYRPESGNNMDRLISLDVCFINVKNPVFSEEFTDLRSVQGAAAV